MNPVDQFIDSLTEDRREAIGAVRKAILDNLPEGYEERLSGSTIAYVVPHSLFPAGYHCNPKQPLMYAALASNKATMSLHMITLYGDPEAEKWFRDQYAERSKKLDMGKACVRFKRLDDIALDVVGPFIARMPIQAFIDRYLSVRAQLKSRHPR